ncbi:MAG: 3-hydroxybutyrate dehydrogenase [Gammaproteobacteria bacterium]
MSLKSKRVFITGAASGIGKAIALRFAEAGAYVCIADIDEVKAQAVVTEIEQYGTGAISVVVDVADEKAVEHGVAAMVEKWGGVDILISNAGVQHIKAVNELAYKDWQKIIAIHLDGAFLTTRACLRHMYSQKEGGCILYMGSVHSKAASALKAPYVAAKHALLGLCRTVAIEGAEHNVRANVICPGFVRTPLVDKQIPEQALDLGITEDEVIKSVMLKETVDGEFTTTEDVAELAVFLADFPSKALTGQSMIVSHGWHME